MIRAHVDESQNNWDQGIKQLCFSYNSSVHDTTGFTPFLIMFGRESRIPIDLLFPNKLDLNRERISEEKTVKVDDIPALEISPNENFKEIDLIPDCTHLEIEEKFPLEAREYVRDLRQNMGNNIKLLEKNRLFAITKHKEIYERNLKRFSYKIGDWVLCNHPQIKKGLSRGLAPRYHGPFIIVGKYSNGLDYLIRPHNQPRARVKAIHFNNLKIYHRRGHPTDHIKIDPTADIDIAIPSKRTYIKNVNNPRWQNKKKSDLVRNSESDDLETDFLISEQEPENHSVDADSEDSDGIPEKEPLNQQKRRGRPPGRKNNPILKLGQNKANVESIPIGFSKFGRAIRPPKNL